MKKIFCILILLLIPVSKIHSNTVCLDPGHGGSDPGAEGTWYTEKEANLDVALTLQDSLWTLTEVTEVRMTRTSDVDVSLEERVAIANLWPEVDRFISIHHNDFNGEVQGTETFCHPDASADAFDLRDKTHPWLVEMFGYPDRGVKTADFYVLRETIMPAILGEASFIDYDGVEHGNESYKFWYSYEHADSEALGYFRGYKDHYQIGVEEYYIQVNSPNGGEVWYFDEKHDITWNTGTLADTLADSVVIYYSVDGGSTYPYRIAKVINSSEEFPWSGSYSWTIPRDTSTTCRVKVRGYFQSDPEYHDDVSDGNFTIKNPLYLSGQMVCTNPKSGVNKDIYHFQAHLSWTFDASYTPDNYGLYRKLLKPREGDPTGWWRIYYGSDTSKIDPYDFEEDDAAWYYVKAYITGSPYIKSNTIYLVADAPPSPPQGLSGVWEHIGKDWADITLSWDPNAETDLSGYYVYRSESSSGPFNNVGTVGALAEPEFVDRVYAWRPYWYFVTAFDTLDNESGPSDTIKVEPEYYPGPCPFLYVWDGFGFVGDNNILAGSGQGDTVTDFYKLTKPLIETEPPRRYKLEIREEQTEHSFFDLVSLRTIDHPDDVEIGVNVEDEIVPITTAYTPLSAISGGEDYTDVLSNDTSWFEGLEGDTMIIEFGAIENVVNKELWLNSDKHGYPIVIEIYKEDSWEYVASAFPRENFSSMSAVSLSGLIGDNEALTLRLIWLSDHNLKTIRIVNIEDVVIVERISPLIFAFHSRLGNVRQSLLYEDGEFTEVLPGDTLRLIFGFRVKIPRWERSFVFLSNGYYSTEKTGGGGGTQTVAGNQPILHSILTYPNPAKNNIIFNLGIPREEQVTLKIFDVSGREVKALLDKRVKAGYHIVRLDDINLPSGIYFARLVTDNYKETKRLVVMR